MREEKVLSRATFSERLPTYWMFNALLLMAVTFIGIPLIPIWLFVGWKFHRRQLERMECVLTERTLNVRWGVLFRVEKSIPLDKIQDVSMREGPLLRYLELSSLAIETAGQSGQGAGDARLAGVIDAPAFRDAILNQRDAVVAAGGSSTSAAAALQRNEASDGAVLTEIRDSLLRVERLLQERREG